MLVRGRGWFFDIRYLKTVYSFSKNNELLHHIIDNNHISCYFFLA